jgi:hypothetical protein
MTKLPAVTAEETVPTKVSQRVQEYITIRDKLKEIDDEFDAKRKPYVELQNLLTGWLQTFMETAGADNIKTPYGTCYNSTRYTASLADPQVFMDFVENTKQYDLLDRKANVTAVKAYVEEHKTLPPGVNLSAIKTVGVRRK